ncbi:hypothetical protein HYZ76_02205 [Candidatus Falkowbacteria bacterium]|nr:hypothetical protein [Candidatus Falkowbacteria bacterium]
MTIKTNLFTGEYGGGIGGQVSNKFQISNFKFQIANFRPQGGYIALIALLVVAAAGITIGIAVSLTSIEEIQVSFGISQAAKAKSLAGACIEESLERLRNDWNNYSGSLSIDGNLCIMNTVINGSTATVESIGSIDIYQQKIKIQVDNNFSVIAWQEE